MLNSNVHLGTIISTYFFIKKKLPRLNSSNEVYFASNFPIFVTQKQNYCERNQQAENIQ